MNYKFNGVQSGIATGAASVGRPSNEVNSTYQPSMKTFGVDFN